MSLTKEIFLLLFIILFFGCKIQTDAYMMRNSWFDDQTSHQVLIVYNDENYDIITYSNYYENITKEKFGNCELSNDTLSLFFSDHTKQFLISNSQNISKIYPILAVEDTITHIVDKYVSYGFEKRKINKNDKCKILRELKKKDKKNTT